MSLAISNAPSWAFAEALSTLLAVKLAGVSNCLASGGPSWTFLLLDTGSSPHELLIRPMPLLPTTVSTIGAILAGPADDPHSVNLAFVSDDARLN